VTGPYRGWREKVEGFLEKDAADGSTGMCNRLLWTKRIWAQFTEARQGCHAHESARAFPIIHLKTRGPCKSDGGIGAARVCSEAILASAYEIHRAEKVRAGTGILEACDVAGKKMGNRGRMNESILEGKSSL